jgi:hypothetical protein
MVGSSLTCSSPVYYSSNVQQTETELNNDGNKTECDKVRNMTNHLKGSIVIHGFHVLVTLVWIRLRPTLQ